MAMHDHEEFDVHNSAKVKSTLINKAFQEGFNEAMAAKGLAYTVKVALKFERHLMNQREFEGVDLVDTIKRALEWAGAHLLQGADTEAIIWVGYVNDVPGTEVVEAELVENGQ